MTAQSIPELTNNEYNELYYDSAGTLITGSFVTEICDLLNKCSVDVQITDTYDDTVASAVSQFQKKANIKETGILSTSTLQAMILYANEMNDVVNSDEEDVEITVDSLSESPHYTSFFDDNNYKMHRRNHKDIKIVFGNKSITKTIKDVFMRGVTVEVDTSGNPISEVYEFIARDIKESDEISDINKYIGEEALSLSDIKYDFSSIGVTSSSTTENKRVHGGVGGSFSTHGGRGGSF